MLLSITLVPVLFRPQLRASLSGTVRHQCPELAADPHTSLALGGRGDDGVRQLPLSCALSAANRTMENHGEPWRIMEDDDLGGPWRIIGDHGGSRRITEDHGG